MRLRQIRPAAGVPGGIVRVEMDGLSGVAGIRAEIGDVEAEFLGASNTVLTLRIPEASETDEVAVYQAEKKARSRLRVARVIATDLHCVSNPVVDSRGQIYCTFSGTRGEKVPFSVYVVDPESGEKQPFLADITNPTGLAISPDDHLYISSRHTGTIYRSSFDKQVEKFVDGLGLATGIAFDSAQNLIVGDRSGTLYRISPDRQVAVLCELEPSVSAYHLALGPDGDLFVTGPTLSTQDSIYRVSPGGTVDVFFKGFGRPQGMAFDKNGTLHVAASYQGKKGIYSFHNGSPEWTVSGPMLVGLAYSPVRDAVYLVDSSRLYALNL